LVTGDIIGWQNSDDIYLPKAFEVIVESYQKARKEGVYFGNIIHLDESDQVINKCFFRPKRRVIWDYHYVNIANQGMFFTKTIKDLIRFDVSKHYAMDVELYYWLDTQKVEFIFVNEFLGGFRIHENAKTNYNQDICLSDMVDVKMAYKVDVRPASIFLGKMRALYFVVVGKVWYGGFAYYLQRKLWRV
jgi:hypothetical protein